MKKFLQVLFIVLAYSSNAISQDMNIMTFNIRYNTARDSVNAWPNRKEFAASQIRFHKIQVVGVQEALVGQLQDLLELLPGFKYVGVGRDKGDDKGEFSAILYDTTRLTVLEQSTFWLSETPSLAGSKGWDAAFPRVVTWAKFKDRRTQKVFYLFNTHFDHMGKLARRSSASLLLAKVEEIAKKQPAIVTGDFNAEPTDEPIKIITDPANPLRLIDTRAIAEQGHYGPDGTFNGFQSKENSDQPIDYIFIKGGKFKIKQHATLSQTWGGRFSSDHFPVMAEIVSSE
jgi:endonuclease/exonuclease/phosphatase family metal-dependent hydrolase